MSVLYCFHKVKQLLTIEHLHAEVIQYEQVGLCEFGKEPVQGTGDACKRYLLKETVNIVVCHLESVHAGLMPQGSTEPALACSCRSCYEHGYSIAHIVASGEVEYLLLVHSAFAVVDDLADRGLVAEAGFLTRRVFQLVVRLSNSACISSCRPSFRESESC